MNDSESTFLQDGQGESDTTSWSVTYADLITLLLTFFILLFSISELELEKFKKFVNSVKISFGVAHAATDSVNAAAQPTAIAVSDPAVQQQYEIERRRQMLEEITEFIKARGLHESILISLEHSKIVIRVKDRVFYNLGSSDLNLEAVPIMDEITNIFETYEEFKIDIEVDR